jgi:DNA invertase Pin-like site-specific DNA recombinase
VYLLVESLDRLSRERPFKAAHQLEEILAGGVKVVTLCDGKTFDENSLDNIGDVIKAICSMAIAHEEVARKSKRIKESWVGRYEKAKSGEIISRNLPAWLEMKNGRPVKRSKVVVHIRRIYELAASGVPKTEIARILNREKVPTLNDLKGRKQKAKTYWQDVSIGKLLTGKAVLGTLKTVHGDVENYYPAIIDPPLRAKVLRICRTHKSNRGRQTDNYTNLLRKIGFDCQTGDPIYCTQTRTGGNFRNYYMSKAVRHGADGIRWKGGGPRGFEEALLESMRIALHLENNIDNLKEDLDLKEHAYAETTASIEKLVDFIDSGDMEIEEIRERLVELRKVKVYHEQEILELKDHIKASDVNQLIDLESGSRRDVYHCIRANVERVDLNCEKRWFRIVLQNGKIYEADYSKCIDSMVKIDASTSIKSEVGLLSVNKAA